MDAYGKGLCFADPGQCVSGLFNIMSDITSSIVGLKVQMLKNP